MDKEILKTLFPEQVERIERGVCSTCGGKIGEFIDNLSFKEYMISGMCQTCQDKTFSEPVNNNPKLDL